MTAAKLRTCMFICTLHTHLCDLYNWFLQAEYVHFCHELFFKIEVRQRTRKYLSAWQDRWVKYGYKDFCLTAFSKRKVTASLRTIEQHTSILIACSLQVSHIFPFKNKIKVSWYIKFSWIVKTKSLEHLAFNPQHLAVTLRVPDVVGLCTRCGCRFPDGSGLLATRSWKRGMIDVNLYHACQSTG